MKIQSISTVVLSLFLSVASSKGEGTKENFESGEVPASWQVAKGEWKVVDGALVGKELAGDKHAAVLTIPDEHGDSTISFKFKPDGMKMFALSYNHPKGHLFRIKLDPTSAMLMMDKDKKDPASNGETLAKAEYTPKSGEWIEVRCEVKGDTVTAKIGDIELSGTHKDLTKPKTGFRFVVSGESAEIDDVEYESSKAGS